MRETEQRVERKPSDRFRGVLNLGGRDRGVSAVAASAISKAGSDLLLMPRLPFRNV